jgi:uncharacterized protein YdiU (UPF0061 family)
VFSSIDHGRRYAYGAQAQIAQWNLARLAESLLPLIHPDDQQRAVSILSPIIDAFADRLSAAWQDGMHAKLGLGPELAEDEFIVEDLLGLLEREEVDWTSAFCALARVARGDADALGRVVPSPERFAAWTDRWMALAPDAELMDRRDPRDVLRDLTGGPKPRGRYE